jgi:hypothetical protein
MSFLDKSSETQAKMLDKIILQKNALIYIDESLQEFSARKNFKGTTDDLITERIMWPQVSLIEKYTEMKDSLVKISSCSPNEMVLAKNKSKNEIQLLLENVSN